MTFPPTRLSVRQMMSLVALVAVVLGAGITLLARRERFLASAELHAAHWNRSMAGGVAGPRSGLTLARWHAGLRDKYLRAAASPWLPVAPDPPPPRPNQ
jgi:hypothetical protein